MLLTFQNCPALLETVSLRVPNRNFGDLGFFNVDLKLRNCLPFDALQRQMQPAVILICSIEVTSPLTLC